MILNRGKTEMLSLFGMTSVQCRYIGPAVQTPRDKSKLRRGTTPRRRNKSRLLGTRVEFPSARDLAMERMVFPSPVHLDSLKRAVDGGEPRLQKGDGYSNFDSTREILLLPSFYSQHLSHQFSLRHQGQQRP
jgi:hypothetical protein